jgi:L-seryl-tRNA(Ser) seleniumtransferase
VPPVDNFWKYTKMGFDLVAISGGKGIRGPQSSGLLLGRKDLIEAARLNAPPNGNTVGRGMKVNKEEMLGLLVAVERFLKTDHAAERREYDKRAETIRAAAVAVPGVKAEVFVPEIANNVPHVRISWDGATETAAGAVVKAMKDGEPSIGIRSEANALVLGVWMMKPGEDKVVARRLREVLASPAAKQA